MKVKKESVEEFTPFNLVLTIETKAEASALYNIFNYTFNTDLLPSTWYNEIQEAIGSENQYTDRENRIIAGTTAYSDFYKPKVE